MCVTKHVASLVCLLKFYLLNAMPNCFKKSKQLPMFAKYSRSNYEKSKNLKHRKHAAETYCAPYKHRGRYKDAVETSCGRCRDAVRTLCTAQTDHTVIGIFFYLCNDFMYHLWHGEITFHLLYGPRMPPVKITALSVRFHTRLLRSIAKI